MELKKIVLNEIIEISLGAFLIMSIVGAFVVNKNITGIMGIVLTIITLIFTGFIYLKNYSHKKYKITTESVISNDELIFSIILGAINSSLMLYGIITNNILSAVVLVIVGVIGLNFIILYQIIFKKDTDSMILDELKNEIFKKSSFMSVVAFWIYLVLVFNYMSFLGQGSLTPMITVGIMILIMSLNFVICFIYCNRKYLS
jgi:hypothetical protein